MTASTPKHAGFGPLLSHPTHKPTNRPNSLPRSGCALRGWAEGPARKPGDSQNRDTRSPPTAVTPAAVRRQRRVQRAPSSCSPPPGMASDCATLRSQEHGQFVFGRSQRRTNTEHERSISALRIRGLRADRYHGASATRFQPKAKPRVRLTAAPLSLRRCRSALERWQPIPLFFVRAPLGNLIKTHRCILTISLLRRGARFSVARGNSCRIGSPPIGRICPLTRAGDGASFSSHALGDSFSFGSRRNS